MSKYHNVKAVVDGIKFDSKLEAERYIQLKELEKEGRIKELELQPCFELVPAFEKNGKKWRRMTYVADFRYFSCADDKCIVEDVKGSEKVLTDVFKLKQKLFEYLYHELTINIVTRKDIKHDAMRTGATVH